MFPQNNIVLIGNSVTEHSKSLLHLKRRVINIDTFNDSDLLGENYKNSNKYGYVNQNVVSILRNLKLNNKDTIIIVTSGYENNKNYFNILQKYGIVIGNNLKTFFNVNCNDSLFQSLKKNKIYFPEVLNASQKINGKFLKKNIYLSGGFGIKKFNSYSDLITHDKNEYFQKYIRGQVYSILFISTNNKKFKIIGINKIFSKKTVFSDYTFSGAVSNVSLNDDQLIYLNKVIKFFINEYGLVGINGIDFVVNKEIFFLEVNPRITQTCYLYENNFYNGYVCAHINSILNNKLPIIYKKINSYMYFETLFANTSFFYNYNLSKYNFVSNIPKKNTYIELGEPICTITVASSKKSLLNKIMLNNISLIKNELKDIEII